MHSIWHNALDNFLWLFILRKRTLYLKIVLVFWFGFWLVGFLMGCNISKEAKRKFRNLFSRGKDECELLGFFKCWGTPEEPKCLLICVYFHDTDPGNSNWILQSRIKNKKNSLSQKSILRAEGGLLKIISLGLHV